MYTLVTAYAVKNTPQAHWANVDLGASLLSDIYQTYRKVYLTLSNPVLLEDAFVDMDAMRRQYQGFQGTLNELLASIGSTSLPTVSSIPVASPKYVKYADAFSVGYKLKMVSNTGADVPNTPDQHSMLRLSRPSPATDMGVFYKNCLVSINGFFYQTDTDGTYAYVVDAGRSLLKSRQNQIGILNFLDIGELEQIPITEDMIFTQNDTGATLKERAYIRLPSTKSVVGKVPMLVCGGYLNFVGASFWQSGEDVFSVDFHAMRLLNRYYESLPYINYDYLGLTGTSLNKEQVSVEQFYSDEVLTKLLTGTQSFLVLVNTDQLFTNKVRLRGAKLPGMFVSEHNPTYPLMMGYGRVAEYWKTYEDKQWSLTVKDNLLNHRVFDYNNAEQARSVSDQRVPYQPFDFSRGYLLEIGKDF